MAFFPYGKSAMHRNKQNEVSTAVTIVKSYRHFYMLSDFDDVIIGYDGTMMYMDKNDRISDRSQNTTTLVFLIVVGGIFRKFFPTNSRLP